MTGGRPRESLLRARSEHQHGKVTFVELFFDLVFVFAITQLSHLLLAHFTPMGAVETVLLLMAVWWAWIYTSWITNWLDPERAPVRLALFALMLAGLLMSVSIPKAFESRGLTFAAAYVLIQVGRTLFMLWALRSGSDRLILNFQRVLCWLLLSAVFWIAGALAEGHLRLALWVTALLIEYVSPSLGFWTPHLGRSATSDWDIDGGHLAERCGLFIIIALGESILVIGATFSGLPWTPATVGAFLSSFVSSVAMWWIYFNIGAEAASRRIVDSSDPGRIARLAYTYIQIFIVAGIIVTAVGDEFVLAHPTGHTEVKAMVAMLGGAAFFLIGNILFKRATANRTPLSHLVGLGLLCALIPVSLIAPPVLFSGATSLVLVAVAVWETASLTPRPAARPS
jgi:low temperature requirement protein LtrA